LAAVAAVKLLFKLMHEAAPEADEGSAVTISAASS
jgi:hypothetical protein